MLDNIRHQKHHYEQEAYSEIRHALSEDFLEDPQAFVTHFGKRPEDLGGADLREHYPHMLVQQRQLRSKHDGFKKRFAEGRLF